jgi:hypothetical protein
MTLINLLEIKKEKYFDQKSVNGLKVILIYHIRSSKTNFSANPEIKNNTSYKINRNHTYLSSDPRS